MLTFQMQVLSRYNTVKLILNFSNVSCLCLSSKGGTGFSSDSRHTPLPHGSVGCLNGTRDSAEPQFCLSWHKTTIDGENCPLITHLRRSPEKGEVTRNADFLQISPRFALPAKGKVVSKVTDGFRESLQQMTARSLTTRKEKSQCLYSNCHAVYYMPCSAVIQKVESCSALLGSAVQNRLNLFWTLPAPCFI